MSVLKTFLNKYFPYLLLFLLVIVSYYSISLFQYAFKWDMADQYFPWRYLVSEHLQAGQLPLWNPYQNGGYPMHGDPQSAAWYPIVWILSLLTGGYTIYTLHIEFILTIYIAAIGFYKLSKHFQYATHTSILLAYTYCCSGFFAGNAQHFTWIISGAFLPFVFYYYLKTLQAPILGNSLKTALALFFILSGGYPAFLIIVSYILLALLIIKLVEHVKNKDYSKTSQLLSHQFYIAIAFLLCSSVILYSIIYCKPFITRGESVTAEAALFMPFTLPSFLSFLFPFATCHHSDFIHTDISMSNAYIGIVGFVFFILFLFRKNKTGLQKTFLTIGLISLTAAVGSVLPVRTFLYDYLPFMNLFRFPSAFRIFFMISFLLLAGSELDKNIGKQVIPSYLKLLYGSVVLILFVALGLSVAKNYSGTGIVDYFFNTSFFNEHCTAYDHIIIQASIHLVLLIITFIVYVKYKENSSSLKWILTCFIIADVLIALNMNMKYTALNENAKPKDITLTLKQMPQGFPIPTKKIQSNNDNIQTLKPFWKNLNIFRKEIAYDGYNPFFLKNYETLEMSGIYESGQDNEPIYLANEIINIEARLDTTNLRSQQAYLNTKDYLKFSPDSVRSASNQINVLTYTGNGISMQANTQTPKLIVLYQNFMPGWKAIINNKETNIIQVNHTLMAIPISDGLSKIDLIYAPAYLYLFFGLSILSLIGMSGYIFYTKLFVE